MRRLDDPDDAVAEVRLNANEEFQPTHEFLMSGYALTQPDEYPDLWEDMPALWTREFWTLAQMWARLTDIAEFGGTYSER